MRKNFFVFIFVLSFLVSSAGVAQEKNIYTSLNDLEKDALQAESKGNYNDAIKLFETGFQMLLAEYKSSADEEKDFLSAIAEAYLHKLMELYVKSSRFTDAIKLLEKEEVLKSNPDIRKWVLYYLADCYAKAGEISKVREKYQELSFIRDWQIIGPFDNENGSGFNAVYAPEQAIDLDSECDGKKNSVLWRQIKLDSILGGYINFKSYLYPSDDSVSYAVTYVFSGESQPVVFRASSEGSLKLWLNREQIFANDIQRKRCTLDQDSFTGYLSKGWNSILVKSGVTKGQWGLKLRITDTEGKAIKGLKYEVRKELVNDIILAEPKKGDVFEFRRNSVAAIEEKVEDDSADLISNCYFYMGVIHQAWADYDIHNPADRDCFLQAVRTSRDSPYYRYYLAKSLFEKGVSLPEREENIYRMTMENVIELNPSHILALVDMAEYYLVSLNNKAKCRAYLDKALSIKSDFEEALFLEVKLLKEEGLVNEAYLRLKSLSDINFFNSSVQYDFAGELMTKGKLEEAGMIYGKILKTIDYSNNAVRQKLIAVFMRTGRLNEALQLYDSAGILDPSDTDYYLERSKIYASCDKYESALKEVEKALKICPDNPVLMDFFGEYLSHLGNSDKALEIWEKVIRLNPNFISLQRYVEWKEVTGDSFEAPYNESFESLVKRAGVKNELISQYAAYYLLNQAVVKLNKDGTSRQYLHRIIKIIGEKGVKEFQQIRMSYNPEKQKLKVINCRILYPNGRSLEGNYSGGSFIKLPPLEIGSIIDIEYRVDDLQQGFFGTYFGDIFFLGTINPVYKAAYTIITPSDRPLYFNLKNIKIEPKITTENDYIAYVWTAFNIDGFIPEPFMPPSGEIIPLIQVSTYKEWKEFGKWYWNLVKKQYDINDDMRDMLKRITHPMMNTREKIATVYNFTIGVIRYVAWEFGIHGWKPYKASTIFARRFGDCKDKATIINVFLNELGITSYPVLIYADDRKGEDDLTLPMVEHFNHCIACVKLKDGKEIWLDGTAVFNRAGSLPATDTDAKVFVINEEGGEVKYIPPISPTDSGRHEINDITIHKKGSARVETGVTFVGDQSGEMRYMLFNPTKRNMVVERMFGPRFGGTQVTYVETSPLGRLDIPATLTITANVPYFMAREGRDFSFRPVLFPQDLASFVTQSERKFDLLLSCFQFPYEDNIQTVFRLPLDMKVKSLPENINIDNKLVTFILNYRLENETIIFTEKVSIKKRRIRAEDYKEFRSFCNKIAMEEEREIIITPEK